MRRITHLVVSMFVLLGGCAQAMAQVTDAQRAAIKSACRSDYMNVCAGVPTGGAASLQCLQQHSQQVSSGCRDAVVAAVPSAAPTAPSGASAPPAAAPQPAGSAPAASVSAAPQPTARPLSPREEARVLRSTCGGDFRKLCSGVQLGGGRGAACLRAHATQLTSACQSALLSAAPPK